MEAAQRPLVASPQFQQRQTPEQKPRQEHPQLPSTTPHSATPDPKVNVKSRVRLPSTIEASLAPHASTSKLQFAQALASDQQSALQPDYRTPFRSANDVVRRLLPYHVWHVNDADIQWTLENSNRKRRKVNDGLKEDAAAEEKEEQSFPSKEEAYQFVARYSRLASKAKRLRYELTGAISSTDAALFGRESLYNIERASIEYERELLTQDQEDLRRAKESAIEAGVAWETLMQMSSSYGHGSSAAAQNVAGPSQGSSAAANASTTVAGNPSENAPNGMFQKSVGSLHMTSATSASPRPPPMTSGNPSAQPNNQQNSPRAAPPKGSKPRGRPRKSAATPAAINRSGPETPKPAGPAAVATASPRPSPSQPTFRRPPPPPPPVVTPAPTPPAPSSAIPSTPIPLVLPLSTLAQLSSLGIAPVPAPHLLPAISAQQEQARRRGEAAAAGPSPATNPLPLSAPVHSTAPRPAPLNQQEPALLMGITEAPLHPRSSEGAATPSTQQMLHVSVVLSKLSPSQLSGLAALMQKLQPGQGQKSTNGSSAGKQEVKPATQP